MKLIPLADGDIWRELGLVYRRDRSLPRSAAAFVNIVRQMPGALEGRAHKK